MASKLTLAHLDRRVAVIEAAQVQLAANHAALALEIRGMSNMLEENTKLTKQTADNTKGVVQAFTNMQGGLKVMGSLGKVAAIFSAVASAGLTAWLSFKAFFR